MPALDVEIVKDLEVRLSRYLSKREGYGDIRFLNAGGSAAVFRATGPEGARVFKLFNPAFFNGGAAAAERRRLELQQRLIGHSCGPLVQTFAAEEAEGTAVVEMEFVPWPQLGKVLEKVPDSAITSLVAQLVEAAQFLESLGVVHRDIKPENIHVSEDFTKLKLLDLGVAREYELPSGNDAAETDQGAARPFLATAQYSSPEYLFRLDEPTTKLWRGLTFYQIGAVMYELIEKTQLFANEMGAGNRWLVARAVLTQIPGFRNGPPDRLSALKALALRCLTKDLDSRLQLVGWGDFVFQDVLDPLAALKGRLAKGTVNAGKASEEASHARLDFDRAGFLSRFIDRVRTELFPICGKHLPLTVRLAQPAEPPFGLFLLMPNKETTIACRVDLEWQSGLFERNALISLRAELVRNRPASEQVAARPTLVFVASILENEDAAVVATSSVIASAAMRALDLLEATKTPDELDGHDLAKEREAA